MSRWLLRRKGTVVVFLVRVILFMMSRRAADAGSPAAKPAADAMELSRRARLTATRESSGAGEVNHGADGPITREEMTRLFGNALRVR